MNKKWIAAAWAALVILVALPLVGCGGNSSVANDAQLLAKANKFGVAYARAVTAKDVAALEPLYSGRYLHWGATKSDELGFWREIFATPDYPDLTLTHLGAYGVNRKGEVVSVINEWRYHFNNEGRGGPPGGSYDFTERQDFVVEGGKIVLYGNQITPDMGMVREPDDRTLREEIQRHIR